MLRSMFAAVSGLRSHGTMMDVVGNNIANVNTTGFKASRTTFQEALTQVVRGATPAAAGQVGVNPLQIGLGTRVAATDGIFGQGATQVTGRATDLAIQGEGFFVVEKEGLVQYTRAGAYGFDAAFNMVGPSGELLQGFLGPGFAGPPVAINLETARTALGLTGAVSDISVNDRGQIAARVGDETVILAQVALARFDNPGGLTRAGGSLFVNATNAAGAAQIGAPGADGRGTIQSGTLEMSNVDLAQEFTNLIMAQRGFQANARTVTSSDEMLQELVDIKR
jgi:flagellar hook protein FlgE